VSTFIKKTLSEHLLLITAIALTLAIYSKFLFFGHISWDDPEMVFKNKVTKEFDLKAMFSGHFVGNYIPFTMTLHAFAWKIFGNFNGGHHLLNVLLHLVNGILVFFITNRFFSNKKISGLTTLIFLLHPLQLESVGWISELKNVLSATFYFISILYYFRYSETNKTNQYIYSFLFFTAGCLSKSSVVILPLTLIGIDVFLKQKIKISFIGNKIPFFIISLLFGIINLKTQAADLFINYSHAFPYHERLGYAGFALLKYLFIFLAPYNLSVLYPYPPDKILALVIGFVFLLFMTALIFHFNRKKNYTILALFFLCISSLVIVLQFVPFGEVLYADRYMYTPLLFFTLLLLFLFHRLKVNLNYLSYFLVAVLPVITYLRMDVWKNSSNLYSDILKKYPNSFVALNSLGAELMMQNNDAKALEYLNKSIKVSPHNYKGYYNRGLLFLKTNEPKSAIADFNKAIELYNYNKAYIGRASAYYMLQDIPNAMRDANYVLLKDSKNVKALFVLANCLNSTSKLDMAIDLYNRSIEIADDEPDFYFKRAIAYGKKQDFIACLNDLDKCIGLNPSYFEAYYWRGVAKVNLKQDPCENFKIAAQNNIQSAVQALNNYCK
jgi:tetratricopeptide (TPR) repeat protein